MLRGRALDGPVRRPRRSRGPVLADPLDVAAVRLDPLSGRRAPGLAPVQRARLRPVADGAAHIDGLAVAWAVVVWRPSASWWWRGAPGAAVDAPALGRASPVGGPDAPLRAQPQCGWRATGPLRAVTTPAGSPAPDFTARLLTGGGETRLSDAAGHPLVMAFWASWCEPCKAELPALDRLYQRFSPSGTRFLAVNIEEPEMRAPGSGVRARHRPTAPVVVDGGPLSLRYHVETIPHLVILDGEGKVRDVLNGVHAESEVRGQSSARTLARLGRVRWAISASDRGRQSLRWPRRCGDARSAGARPSIRRCRTTA